MYQDLSKFKLPPQFRSRSPYFVQLWWLVQVTIFRWSPRFMYPFRSKLLRLFGAEVGANVIIRPTVTVTYPWKVIIGDYSWIGDDVVLYSLGEIEIGKNSVVSQRSYLCAADHDSTQIDFPIRSKKVTICSEVWVATDVFIGPGVTVGEGAVIGARSSVFKDMPSGMFCFGHPCVAIKKREIL